MGRAGVDRDTAERAVGHLVGNAIERTYDRHTYEAAKRRAFEALAGLLDLILDPPAGNVVPLNGLR